MSSAIDYKFRVLFGTHTKCSSYNQLRLTSSLVLYSARTKTHKTHKSSKIDYNTHRNAYVKQDCLKFPTIFGTHRKRIFQVRLNTSLAPYSSLTETHMSSNVIKPNYFATPPVDTLPQIVQKRTPLRGKLKRFGFVLMHFLEHCLSRINS